MIVNHWFLAWLIASLGTILGYAIAAILITGDDHEDD